MPGSSPYLQQRQQERRWRVVTALVVALTLAAAGVWMLDSYAEPMNLAAGSTGTLR